MDIINNLPECQAERIEDFNTPISKCGGTSRHKVSKYINILTISPPIKEKKMTVRYLYMNHV